MAASEKTDSAPTPAAGGRELDELTLRRAQRGDGDAFRQLVVCYQDRVFALLSRLLHGRGQAVVEDIAQDTFLQVFRALESFAPLGPARLSTWVLTIATRRAIDELRRKANAPAPPLPELSSGQRADAELERARLGRAIAEAVSGLTADHRAAFVLREYHGFAYDEIARALDIDVGTVKSRLSRARRALREALAHHREPQDVSK